ncbi:MAG: Cof-type HAD-IIB family hydrolase [Ginsengibacter sp.]
MYKAVFIDIDGTLIKSDHTISKATFAIIQKLKEKNILVILVSARPLSGILSIIEETGLLKYPVASLNGAYITADEKIIFDSTIDVATITRVHEWLQKYNATTIYYEQVQWFSEFQNAATDYEQKITLVPITIQPFSETLQHWQYKNTGPNKIHVIAKAAVVDEIQNNLKQQFINDLNIATSKPTYLEVINIAASKLNAVKLLIDHYNITREEVIAIGDNFNDKEMIEFAGTGIAMGNAPAEVKAVADYVTDTNNKDGVAKAIIKFIGL